MVKLSQFVSRNIMTRDKMSQPLVACGLVLGACGSGSAVDFYLFSNILRRSNPFRFTVQYSLL